MRIAAVRPRPDRERALAMQPGMSRVACFDVDVLDDALGAYNHTYGYSVIVSRDDLGHDVLDGPDPRWHVSVASEERTPPWSHFVAIVHRVRPGVAFCMPMPTPDKWLNVHEHCLHAWQIDDAALEAQWASEGRALRTPPT